MNKSTQITGIVFAACAAVALIAFIATPIYHAFTDVDYTFPGEAKGTFITEPSVVQEDQITTITWSVPSTHTRHTVEYRKQAPGDNGVVSGNSDAIVVTDNNVTTVTITLSDTNIPQKTVSSGTYEYQAKSFSDNATAITSELLTFTIE